MRRIRWTMIIMGCSVNTINYIDRANLAVAAPSIQHEFGISTAMMGVLLSAFFWTYTLMQLPFGWFADRVGTRITMAAAVSWWSVSTILTATAHGLGALTGFRLLLGIGEAGACPSVVKLNVTWFPRRERAFAASVFDSGGRIGAALSLPLVAWLIGSFNWRVSFVVTGLIGIAWTVLWLFVYRDPENHPSVTPEQLASIQAERNTDTDIRAVPWSSLFGYRTIWGMMIGFFCVNFVIYFFITWFPTYLIQARGFSLAQLGTLGLLPGLISIPCGWLGGFTSDALYRNGWSLTAARKTCLVGGMLMSSVITLSVFASNAYVTLFFFAVAYGSLAFTAASIWALPGDVAPTPAHVGSIASIQNTAANVAGIVTATFTGFVLTITGGSFVVPLIVAGAFCLLGAATYLFVIKEIAPLPVRTKAHELT
jgi:ACS family D-galactonate transporter-like MFS transporter